MSVATSDIITIIRGLIDDILNPDGYNTFEYDTDSSFQLSENYVESSTITVTLNGTTLDSADWSYSSTTNKVTITPVTSGVSLTSGDNIEITFSFYEKYSDSEITSYLKSSLVYFTKFKYEKSFKMLSDDSIVTRNGSEPTEDEGDLIALVASIHIDPKNIKIKMPDFTIEAEESLSKNDQINLAINEFGKSYGIVDFIQDDRV